MARPAERTFVPTADYAPYRVTLDCDRYDPDAGRMSVRIPHALGPLDARGLAVEKVRADYPTAVALTADRLCGSCAHGPHEGRCHDGSFGSESFLRCVCSDSASGGPDAADQSPRSAGSPSSGERDAGVGHLTPATTHSTGSPEAPD